MKKFTEWAITFVVLLGLAGLVFGGLRWWQGQRDAATAPRTNHPAPPQKSRVRLVALGDSLTQGVGDQSDQGGYVSRTATALAKTDHVKVTSFNGGRAGDRSDQIQKRLQTQATLQSQVKKADVITMTVGGNDLLQLLEKTAVGTSVTHIRTQVLAGEGPYQRHLRSLLQTIRHFNPTAPIFVLSIYNPFYVAFANVTQLNDAVLSWNQATQTTLAQLPQTTFVDINHLMSLGQYTSAADQQRLQQRSAQVNDQAVTQNPARLIDQSRRAPLTNAYLSTADYFHPNQKGYQLITKQLVKAMQQHRQWLTAE